MPNQKRTSSLKTNAGAVVPPVKPRTAPRPPRREDFTPETLRRMDAVNKNPKMCYVELEDLARRKVVLNADGSSIRFDHDPPFVEHPDGSVTGWESDDFGVDINDGGGIWGDGG